MSIQFNPYEKRWEIFDESSTEDRHQMINELLENGYVAKYEVLKEILQRSASSAERYIKQAIETGSFKETHWKQWKQEAKYSGLSREKRIERSKEFLDENHKVLKNETGRGGRYVVERDINWENDEF